MISIIEAMESEELFGPFFRGKSWNPWKVLLKALFALPMSASDWKLFTECTGRTSVPSEPFDEAFLICGRRSGKSRIAAFIAVYLACFTDWKPYLSPGERATIPLLATDKKQTEVLFNYVSGFLGIPILQKMVMNRTADEISLDNFVDISIHAASFKHLRGYAIPCALADEVGFWQDGDGANPASEILSALRPAMAQFPRSLLLSFSSPYARRGVLYEEREAHFAKNDSPVLIWQAPSRTMNPTISALTVMRARLRDAASARSEWDAQFRNDLESLFSAELIEGLTIPGRLEMPPIAGVSYVAFTDPSGGQADSFTLAIAHDKNGVAVLDCVRETAPPFSPESVVREYCDLLRAYRISEVHGDRYAAEWCAEQFTKNGVAYRQSERTKSEIYLSFLPMAMSGQVELLAHKKLLNQLTGLERRTRMGGRDSVDHGPGAHDDLANSACGVLVRLQVGHRVVLTYVNKVNELFEKFGDAWRDHWDDGKVATPVQSTVPASANGREVFSENASVMRAQAAQKPAVSCPQCGSTCVVRRGPLYHDNACGREWPVPGAIESPKGQRREVLANMPPQRAPRDFRGTR